ncbi:MAG: universal stress protein [Chloroflexi bacterium]|nr:universal stress protein [Chloroflexota bacterium]
MVSTILVPLDGSTFAERALIPASALARAVGARLVLVRATIAHASLTRDLAAAEIAATQQAEIELAATAERLRATGLDVETHVYYDDPPAAIVDLAGRVQADLIVMSTHGRSGLGRWIYGSVADEVLRRSVSPVLLVPAHSEELWPEGRKLRVLLPLDGSKLAEDSLGLVTRVASNATVDITLLRVIEPVSAYTYAEVSPYLVLDRTEEISEAERYVDRIAARLREQGHSVQVRVESGLPTVTIARVARERGADLIAMATHGHGGIARFVLGSVATGVLQQAATPLLLVRPLAVREAAVSGEPAAIDQFEEVAIVSLSLTELGLLKQGLDVLLADPTTDLYRAEKIRRLQERLLQEEPLLASSGYGGLP